MRVQAARPGGPDPAGHGEEGHDQQAADGKPAGGHRHRGQASDPAQQAAGQAARTPQQPGRDEVQQARTRPAAHSRRRRWTHGNRSCDEKGKGRGSGAKHAGSSGPHTIGLHPCGSASALTGQGKRASSHAAGRNRAIAPLGAGRRGDGEQPVHGEQLNPASPASANRIIPRSRLLLGGTARDFSTVPVTRPTANALAAASPMPALAYDGTAAARQRTCRSILSAMIAAGTAQANRSGRHDKGGKSGGEQTLGRPVDAPDFRARSGLDRADDQPAAGSRGIHAY